MVDFGNPMVLILAWQYLNNYGLICLNSIECVANTQGFLKRNHENICHPLTFPWTPPPGQNVPQLSAIGGDAVEQWIALSSHSKKVLGLMPDFV